MNVCHLRWRGIAEEETSKQNGICTAKTHRGGNATMFVAEIALIVLGLILLVWAMGQAAR